MTDQPNRNSEVRSDLLEAWDHESLNDRSTDNAPTYASSPIKQRLPDSTESSGQWLGGILPIVLGAVISAVFYAFVTVVSWGPLERYFLGHPIAITATVLFWVAIAILLCKSWQVKQQAIYLDTIRDRDLMPSPVAAETPADTWRATRDAGHAAEQWLSTLASLPSVNRASQLVLRLEELLTRQSQRGSTKHMADDLRELSGRDADAAHDSLGLVRIIIWAIPMLGFLGTVIGITQTLGGLDFTDGTAAVDRLKSGLYVAFDTTALGLVLSVLAIFVQFPVERSDQRLLAKIDHRVGHLVSACLPSDETADNQTALIVDLCEGIRVAVAESIAQQAKLWRESIDEAQSQWQRLQDENANKIAEAFEGTLAPALRSHAKVFTDVAVATTDKLENHGRRLHETLTLNAATLASHHQTMMNQCEQLAETNQQSNAVSSLQQSLGENLTRLEATNRAVDQNVAAAASDSMADAMRTLAQAVAILSDRVQSPDSQTGVDSNSSQQQARRAA